MKAQVVRKVPEYKKGDFDSIKKIAQNYTTAVENAEKTIKKIFEDNIKYTTSIDEAIEGSDICFIMTEWKQIMEYDVVNYKNKMKRPLVFDGRNCYSLDIMKNF